MKHYVLCISLLVLCVLGDMIYYEVEPNGSQQSADTGLVAPVRIEGVISDNIGQATDIDWFFVTLPAVGSAYTLHVYDTCSTTTCVVDPQVILHFPDGSQSSPVQSCQTSWIAGKYVYVEVSVGLSGNTSAYGIFIAPSNYTAWNGNCYIPKLVREEEVNDIVPNPVPPPPVRIEGTLSTSIDKDRFLMVAPFTDTYIFLALPPCTNYGQINSCDDTTQPLLEIDSVFSTLDPTTNCSVIVGNIGVGSQVVVQVSTAPNFAGGYGLVIQSSSKSLYNYCPTNTVLPPTDARGRVICDEYVPDNLFEQTNGLLTVPFLIPQASLSNDQEQDFYFFTVNGGTYFFATYASQPRDTDCIVDNCDFDTILGIYDNYGDILYLGDDTSDSVCSFLAVELDPGDYYAVVSSYAADSSGDYSLAAWSDSTSFDNSDLCPNTQPICPSSTGSGLAYGNTPVRGSYYRSHWWVILIIIGVIFAIPLLGLAIFLLLTGCAYNMNSTGATNNGRPLPPRELHQDDLGVSLSTLSEGRM